jgi:hypothetical protein
MKKTILYFGLVNFSLITFSCQEPGIGIKLDKTTASVPMSETLLLNATLTPTNSPGTITWVSSDNKIATINNGLITPISAGKANIVASIGSNTASCSLTITQGTAYRDCLKGTNYYLISMDDLTASTLNNNVIVADFRPDNKLKTFKIWDSSYSILPSVGTNFFGENQNWYNLVVNNVTWSGAKIFCGDTSLLSKFAPIIANSAGYYLHIGIQSSDSTVYLFGLFDELGLQFAVGSTVFNDRGTILPTLTDFPRDGKWHELEIPLNKLKTEQFQYTASMGAKNILWFLSGGNSGTKVNIDALFIYKKF